MKKIANLLVHRLVFPPRFQEDGVLVTYLKIQFHGKMPLTSLLVVVEKGGLGAQE